MSHESDDTSNEPDPVRRFRCHFNTLILLAWTVPPVFGLVFLNHIDMFSAAQLRLILTTPLEPLFILCTLGISVAYFRRFARPITRYLASRGSADWAAAERRMRRFPLDFWAIFLGYLVLAPSSVMLSAALYTDFEAQPTDWFRIHLVALIVSIIVGLPIFFQMLDLFGRSVGHVRLRLPHVTLRTKVFLIGALVPLLIDTMIVQYYWTRTGYFTMETFGVWFTLEVLAIAGSLMAMHSFGQSLSPLEGLVASPRSFAGRDLTSLHPRSTDELGVLAAGYRRLLQDRQVHNDLLQITNRILRSDGENTTLAEVVEIIIDLCRTAVGGDTIFLMLHHAGRDELVCVAQTGRGYEPDGHFRLALDKTSVAAWVFGRGETLAIDDAEHDSRVNPAMRERFHARSALAAPLKVEGRVIGVLTSITTKQAHEYGEEERLALESFAREAALAVHTQVLSRQRAEAEAMRIEREQQVRLLLDSTAEAIFGVDLQGECIFVNSACLRMLGYDREEDLLGANMHELAHHTFPGGRPYPKESCRVRMATLRGESAHSADEVHWRRDGTSFPVEYWSHPIFKNGEIIGSVVTFVDITERKRAEEQLRSLGEYNRLLLESTGDGIFGVDRGLRCTFANRAAAEMLERTAEELQGGDMHELVHHSCEDGTPLPRERSYIYRSIHEDRTFWSNDAVLWKRSGVSFPVQYSSNPIHEDGEVTGAVVVFRNVAEARAMARKMDYLAAHDALTGLVNRREFEQRLGHALHTARSDGLEHILCYMDLDQFKVVNDTCGHVAGDELLRQLSTLLHGQVRQTDTLARLGGDEFGVLFECCPLDQALGLTNQLRATVQDFRFVWEDKTFSVGVSVGVVPIGKDTGTAASALSAADAACYMAKDSGRNRVHVYEADDAELARRRGEMQWVARIHDALDQDQFELCYQPIVPVLGRGAAAGIHFEILVRMREPGGALIPPGAFLPAAERYNLMPAIDRWVVRATFTWLREHRERLGDLMLCTINLSGHSLGDEHLLRHILEQLAALEMPAGRICFEVTETAAVANLSQAVHFMRALKQHGCRFALDDFGSGMSSFAYLKSLPVDFLKIDGNFVRDLVRDPIDRAMVEAINQVGHVMGIQTIAEFVEDQQILDELKHIGVDYAQGCGIAVTKPLSQLVGEDLFDRTAISTKPG
ncbi:MAG: EAL domain-containing protein [Gammaproteobacteria bacterium]|nr:EAL domain-containing protein [Gammaproteobacteria bacterium]NIR96811.1 EAL domain-containing protein [Gammaproteobacteria bacterium]NIT62511.1 EAL domain-containing protein [Gammaproteobacteria bacterium]NIX10534.1 EAL domain-containing protein [Gammaproteobacteria bacterium]NIY31091.1 EAL domain-containing protein [Gammaproteobacteria bacterium]